MRISYKPLLEVFIRHCYYIDKNGAKDFVVEPTGLTRETLNRLGVVFKTTKEGFALYAEVVPGSYAIEKDWSQDVLQFTFLLIPINPRFEQITKLPTDPESRPAGAVFYFSNLRQDSEWNDGMLYLDDRDVDANTSLGSKSIPFINSGSCRFLLRTAAPSGDFRIEFIDRLGNLIQVPEDPPKPYAASTTPEGICELLVDLWKVPSMSPGRYQLSYFPKARNSQGGSIEFYYYPAPIGQKVFGVIELFSTPASYRVGGHPLLPDEYNILQGHAISNPAKTYHVRFASLDTVWRYSVFNKYQSGADLDMVVEDAAPNPVQFTRQPPSPIAGKVVFESVETIALSEKLNSFTLVVKRDGSKFVEKKLPNPDNGIPLKRKNADGGGWKWVSEVNVHV